MLYLLSKLSFFGRLDAPQMTASLNIDTLYIDICNMVTMVTSTSYWLSSAMGS